MAGILNPITIRDVTLRNRLVMPPMSVGLATNEGVVTEELIKHYIQRSEALGLVIIEHSYVTIEGKLSSNQLGIHNDNLIQGLKNLAQNIHKTGASTIIQINHAGKSTNPQITGTQPVAPSPLNGARELKVDEINNLEKAFASATERAVKADFDGVELHGCHGFLLNQFFSPLTNRRNDIYGGSLENRMRFPLEVIKSVRQKLGRKILSYRLGAVDLIPKGIKIEDSKKFAVKMEEAGVDTIHVSGGFCGASPEPLQNTQGYFVPYAKEIKKVVKIPVIGVSGIKDIEYADSIIKKGKADLVAIGRTLLEDPNWAKNAIEKLKSQLFNRATA
ncbi:NADH:flavin oxidoreductase [Candidatus Bathyarchaeota archaeon]|nr:NADH:flavin oxidoreductase [Candidatus Bathyarchaeota archaeon]